MLEDPRCCAALFRRAHRRCGTICGPSQFSRSAPLRAWPRRPGCRLYPFRFILFFTTGAGPGNTTASAPAFSIFASAPALKRWAEIFSFLVNSPLPRIFSTSYRPRRGYASADFGRDLFAGIEQASSSPRLMLETSAPVVVETTLGNAAESGIWPPSKAGCDLQPANWP